MASGGSIPSNRTQAVTFYNTTGLIEKEKGIYLSPRFKNRTTDIGREVRAVYLDILNAVAVKDPDYEGIVVSSWSPQDRDLTVRGNIDDFRLVTDEGDCLNYLVITRNVTKGNVTNTYYYGFFITDVKQAGGSSVRVSVEPDDLTNIFYLHNKHILTSYEIETADYDPFNERMKNCYVQRQHYDRVYKQLGGYWLLSIKLTDISMSEGEIQIGDEVTLLLEDGGSTEISGIVDYVDDRGLEQNELLLRIKTSQKTDIGEAVNFSELVHSGNFYQCDYDFSSIEWERIANVLPANQRIFLNQEESFKFKYQYKDEKNLFSFGDVFSNSEMNLIKNAVSFGSLSEDLRKKILKASMQYIVLELKSSERLLASRRVYQFQGESQVSVVYPTYANLVGGITKASPIVFVPFWNVPPEFEKFKSDIESWAFYAKINNITNDIQIVIPASSFLNTYYRVNQKAFADFVLNAYVVNDIGLDDEMVSFVFNTAPTRSRVLFNVSNIVEENPILPSPEVHTVTYKEGLYLAPLGMNPENETDYGITYDYNSLADLTNNNPSNAHVNYPDDADADIVLFLSGYNSRRFLLNLPNNLVDLKTNFYDPVLEAEPYSFYSLSYLSYELAFNKNRYYEDMAVDLEYFVSLNGAIKLGFIPYYKVEGIKFKYLNESLVFTLPSSLPLVSDSYTQYYYQNMAQMKNQFAVNDYNRGMDLTQHLLLSGPNAVGQRAFRMGGAGAYAETINQFAQMADEAIDWAQSNKAIEMNQKAKLADMGAKPDVVKQTGSDAFYDLISRENRPYLNHYTIDSTSYDSVAKFLERFGYQINLYSTMNVNNRVGWNYVKLISFDWNPAYDIMVGQEENLRKIFSEGVTLLHDKSYLTSGHNYETILDE